VDAHSIASHTGSMTRRAKIAISLPQEVAEGARRAVQRGEASNVSAYITEALRQRVLLDDLSSLLAEMLEESGGPMTSAERRAADRVLGSSKQSRVRKNRR
jgi:Arc/MetJ-type ribon-helix-helix transcriptional regulator